VLGERGNSKEKKGSNEKEREVGGNERSVSHPRMSHLYGQRVRSTSSLVKVRVGSTSNLSRIC
jgi:hypothetical protein